mgnify:CR=1 FL=1
MNDGGEVDLDLGNYERYLNVTLSRDNNITTGKIYREVIEKEVRWFAGFEWKDFDNAPLASNSLPPMAPSGLL